MAGVVWILNCTSSQALPRLNGPPSLPAMAPLASSGSTPAAMPIRRVTALEPGTPVFGATNVLEVVYPGADPEVTLTVTIDIDPKRFAIDLPLQLYLFYEAAIIVHDGTIVDWAPPLAPTTAG
jgi:hypothetical protein